MHDSSPSIIVHFIWDHNTTFKTRIKNFDFSTRLYKCLVQGSRHLYLTRNQFCNTLVLKINEKVFLKLLLKSYWTPNLILLRQSFSSPFCNFQKFIIILLFPFIYQKALFDTQTSFQEFEFIYQKIFIFFLLYILPIIPDLWPTCLYLYRKQGLSSVQ